MTEKTDPFNDRIATVAFGALGGTIAMTGDSGDGITPSLGADDLVQSVARDAGISVRAATLQRVGSASLTPRHLLQALDWARSQVDQGAAGAVISQGTDTLEETAYLWDLLWDRAEPLVVTASMRGPEQLGADGPANVRAALGVASSSVARSRGVMAVLDDQVHAARWVRKSHTIRTDAFVSPGAGPLAQLVEGRMHWFGSTARDAPLDGAMRSRLGEEWPWVPLLEFHLGDDGRLAKAAVAGGAAALVVAASGGGHVSEPAADALAEMAQVVPVVLASRALAGPVLTRTYGYQGAEIDLIRRGLIPAGWLAPLKVRTLIQVGLAAGMDRDWLAQEVARRGALQG